MSSLLYLSIASNLNKMEKLESDKSAKKNRLVVREFFPKLSLIIVLFIPSKSLAEINSEFNTHPQLGVSLVQNQNLTNKVFIKTNSLKLKGGGFFDDFSRKPVLTVLTLLNAPVLMTEMGNYLVPGYRSFEQRHYPASNGRRFCTEDWDYYSFSKFKRLSARLTPDGKKYFTNISIDKARGVIQAEQEKLIVKPTTLPSLIAFDIKFSYVVRGPKPLKYIEIITPTTKDLVKDVDANYYRSLGNGIAKDKTMYENNEDFDQPLWIPSESIGHIVDLVYIPRDLKDFVKQNILIGAKSAREIMFINDSG